MASLSKTLTQIALMACFITVTSKGLEGRMIVSFDSVSTIESSNAICNYSTTIQLKNGKKLCVIDSIEKIEKSLTAQKDCER